MLTVFFLNKHLNGRKLSSHMWFFEGFCRQLKPKYCALVDVGTVPHSMGLVNYYLPMENDKHIGGVSGFMGLYFDNKARIEREWEVYKCMEFTKHEAFLKRVDKFKSKLEKELEIEVADNEEEK